jgi:hypothetical protein
VKEISEAMGFEILLLIVAILGVQALTSWVDRRR